MIENQIKQTNVHVNFSFYYPIFYFAPMCDVENLWQLTRVFTTIHRKKWELQKEIHFYVINFRKTFC